MAGDAVKRLIVAVRRVAVEDPSVLALAYLGCAILSVPVLALLSQHAPWAFNVAGGSALLIVVALLIAPAVGAIRRRMPADDDPKNRKDPS